MNRSKMFVLMACFAGATWSQDGSAYLKQGDSQVKSGQYRQAVASYRQVISLDPQNLQAYERLGDLYSRLGMPAEAAKAYEAVADLLTRTPASRNDAPRQETAQSPSIRTQLAANRPAATPGGANGGSGGGLDGLYFMTRFWPGTGLETATYWFHDGAVVKNPIGSAKTLDVTAESAVHPKEVGTYRLQGAQLIVTLPGGNQQAKYEPESKGCFGWDAGIFCPAEMFKTGTALDGTYSGGASVGGGAVMSSMTIKFNQDGTYQRESVGSFSSRGARTTVSGGSVGSEHGKYRIEGTALHLIPDGGKETVVTTFPYDDGTEGPAPRSVYFGGGMLKRVK